MTGLDSSLTKLGAALEQAEPAISIDLVLGRGVPCCLRRRWLGSSS
jgi:hypothetical protein